MSRSGPAHPTRAGRLLDVERFERVAAPGATALLRLTGRLQARARVRRRALALVVDDGRATHRFAPLPGPAGVVAGGRLMVGFAVPVALLEGPRPAFAFELRRVRIELAAPVT